MNSTIFSMVAAVPLLICVAACDKPATQSSKLSTDTEAKNVETATDKWATIDKWKGQWNGPEGTFLRIDGGAGNYNLTIQNLDGKLTYTGIGIGEEIQFERNGIKETIHASNGAQTGMKWLSDKSDCLTIRVGEGYCRK